jgi:hypothetical protein
VRLADRLRALDDRMVWVDAPKPTLTPGIALLLGLGALSVYVGWALVWNWPLALVGVGALVAGLTAIARFWFADSDAERRTGIAGARIGEDVDEVGNSGVEATT